MKTGSGQDSAHGPDKQRRRLLVGLALAPLAMGAATAPARDARQAFRARIAQLEHAHGGRLGVSVLGADGDVALSHRGGERFLLCSTFKALSAAFVLQRVDRGAETLARAIPVRKADIVSYSPITEKAIGGTMSVAALCQAMVTVSDNTAANLLFATYGGPVALTGYVRSLGDRVTRLDRTETALNMWNPADRDWDTTTPDAIARTLRTLLASDALSPASRDQLRAWLRGSTTGNARLRAGLPPDWVIGDKTGTGPTSTNDIAWIEPPGGGALSVAVYYADAPRDIDAQNGVIAEVGRAVEELIVRRHSSDQA